MTEELTFLNLWLERTDVTSQGAVFLFAVTSEPDLPRIESGWAAAGLAG